MKTCSRVLVAVPFFVSVSMCGQHELPPGFDVLHPHYSISSDISDQRAFYEAHPEFGRPSENVIPAIEVVETTKQGVKIVDSMEFFGHKLKVSQGPVSPNMDPMATPQDKELEQELARRVEIGDSGFFWSRDEGLGTRILIGVIKN